MKQTLIILTIITLLSLYSCEQNNNYKELSGNASQKQKVTKKSTNSDKATVHSDRKLIKTGSIKFESADIKKTKSHITATVNELGGYIAKDRKYDQTDRITYSLEVRVPADSFNVLLDKISKNAKHIDRKEIEVKDVTEEYIDIESRIKTKKEILERYEQLLEQATTVEEILAIEKEIGKLREELESIKGRLEYLKDRIAFSTLKVRFYQMQDTPFGFGSKFINALTKGWDILLTVILGITRLWAVILIVIIAIIIYRRFRKRRKEKNKAG